MRDIPTRPGHTVHRAEPKPPYNSEELPFDGFDRMHIRDMIARGDFDKEVEARAGQILRMERMVGNSSDTTGYVIAPLLDCR